MGTFPRPVIFHPGGERVPTTTAPPDTADLVLRRADSLCGALSLRSRCVSASCYETVTTSIAPASSVFAWYAATEELGSNLSNTLSPRALVMHRHPLRHASIAASIATLCVLAPVVTVHTKPARRREAARLLRRP
jgi:hypothetical protein